MSPILVSTYTADHDSNSAVKNINVYYVPTYVQISGVNLYYITLTCFGVDTPSSDSLHLC